MPDRGYPHARDGRLELQEEIVKRGMAIPVIIMTGHGDVPSAVRAMKAGAMDFLEKPFGDEVMLASVQRALDVGKRTQDQIAEARPLFGAMLLGSVGYRGAAALAGA